MNTTAIGGFSAPRESDRNAFLIFLALVWVGILSGFGTDSFNHVSRHGLDYPLIVHLHAVVFVGWMALFTAQAALIRNRRADLHRRLGLAGAALAATMVVLGPATALIVDARDFAARGDTPEFLIVEFNTTLAFAVLTGAGLLLRAVPAAHRRLMLLGLMCLSTPGFARYLNDLIAPAAPPGFLRTMAHVYLCTDLLILGLGAYDLIARRRLHPAYLAGAAFAFACQPLAVWVLREPWWMAFSLRLIGH